MSLYLTYSPSPLNTRNCAAASFELAQLPGTKLTASVLDLRIGERRFPSGYLSCEIDGIRLERGFKPLKWNGHAELDCEAELQELLAHPLFCERILEPMALDIAGLTNRTFVTEAVAKNRAQYVRGQRPAH